MKLELPGITASPGLAIGRAHVRPRQQVKMPRPLVAHGSRIPEEVARFRWALRTVREELREIRKLISPTTDCAEILEVHLGLLDDRLVLEQTLAKIRSKGMTAEWAFANTVEEYMAKLAVAADANFRAQVIDLEQVEQRVLRQLTDQPRIGAVEHPRGAILVAYDLSPADTAQLVPGSIAGMVTEVGGRTSHTAIVARSLAIPALVGVERATGIVRDDDLLVIDGERELLIINPEAEERSHFERRRRRERSAVETARQRAHGPATTADGVTITVRANVQSQAGVKLAMEQGAEGIGLFRTEFLFLNRVQPPDEEEQYQVYSEAVGVAGGAPVTIRTLDIGGDKLPPMLRSGEEANRALGLRGIRFSLRHRELLRVQLRAILRASAHGEIRLLLPMVSGLEELDQARRMLREVMAELEEEGVDYDDTIAVGVMIEVPSAVVLADRLAEEAAFLSIGSNDLIQYSLAIDRTNQQVAYLYQPLHPAILRMIEAVVRVARRAGTPVALCGEMAGDADCLPVLVGLGLRELSVNALAIPGVKEAIRGWSSQPAEALATQLLGCRSAEEAAARLRVVERDRK